MSPMIFVDWMMPFFIFHLINCYQSVPDFGLAKTYSVDQSERSFTGPIRTLPGILDRFQLIVRVYFHL